MSKICFAKSKKDSVVHVLDRGGAFTQCGVSLIEQHMSPVILSDDSFSEVFCSKCKIILEFEGNNNVEGVSKELV